MTVAALDVTARLKTVTAPGRRAVLAGRMLSGLVILFLVIGAGGKLVVPDPMIANSPPLGLPADPAFYRLLGAILAICTALYAWPRTAMLWAVLLTAYLGGAVACRLRVGSLLFGFTPFGAYPDAVVWGGLWLRDPRVRALRPRGARACPNGALA